MSMPLDPYLAGLVAYVTMIGLTGRPGWRNALGLAIGVYAVVQLAALDTIGLSILLTLLAGRAIGLAVRYAAGSASQRPTALAIATALSAGGLAVTAIRRVSQSLASAAGSRYYAVTTQDRRPARRGGVRQGPAGGGHVLPAVPLDQGARAGGAHRAAVARPHGRAPGAALLRGQGRGRAHAPAAHRDHGSARTPPCSPTSTARASRSPARIPGAPTRSSDGSGTR